MDTWTIVGTVGTLLFGVLSIAQRWLAGVAHVGWEVRKLQLGAVKSNLEQLKQMCNDAEKKGHTSDEVAMARFVSDMAAATNSMGHHIDAMLGRGRPRWRPGRAVRLCFPLVDLVYSIEEDTPLVVRKQER